MKHFYLLSLILFSASCTHRLVPTWYNAEKDGLPITQITDNEVTIRLENLELRERYMIFDMEIENASAKEVTLDLPSMYCYSSFKRFKPLATDSTAENWEQQLPEGAVRSAAMTPKMVDDLYRDKLASKQDAGLLLALLGAGLIIYDLAQDIDDANDENWTEEDAEKSWQRDLVTATSLVALSAISDVNEVETARTAEDLEYIPRELLVEKVVEAGSSIRGKVFIANVFIYKYYRFVIPMDGVSFVFDFRRANSTERQKIRLSSY
ncbi:hypothetical protein FNH22_03930 [Fulvivirga sp. M361]|uniref:hypothetical protein n=1 Tax=Fulvivirga sp. M361 TaxID=2594266 RepID=UPI00117A5560|nr:hypothetical protein [Fulvivirga sp. M361]TRX61214.1 hypothetical protein FNH22_03930 [Fulvivirga sp. M361]